MYTTRHFDIAELVPPDLHRQWHHAPERLFMLFDITALRTLDALRDRYGPIVVNNWHAGGSFRLSGWRPWDCAEGAALSQHKTGRAFDCKFTRVHAEEVREDLARTPDTAPFMDIRRVESFGGMQWFHFDTGNHAREQAGVLVVGRGATPKATRRTKTSNATDTGRHGQGRNA